MIGEERGRETKTTWTTRVAFSCLGTPALPCAYCMEQVLSWTQEREERQKWEGRRRGAALTDPKSHETATDWNHRLSHSRHTQNTDVPPPSHSSSFAQERRQTPTNDGAVHYSSWVQERCLFGTSLSLAGSITQWLHNVSYHFHSIHLSLSLTFNAASGYTSHTHTHCIAFPPGSYVKQLVQLWNALSVISGCMWWKHSLPGFYLSSGSELSRALTG